MVLKGNKKDKKKKKKKLKNNKLLTKCIEMVVCIKNSITLNFIVIRKVRQEIVECIILLIGERNK